MVAVDVQVAGSFDIEVECAVAGDLVEHVVEETDAGIELTLARTIQVDPDPDLGFEGIARDFGLPHCVLFQEKRSKRGNRNDHDSI